MIAWFASHGIGTYYLRAYALEAAALLALAALVWRCRRRWRPGLITSMVVVLLILTVRLVALQNPIALRFYQRHSTVAAIGVRQMGTLDLDIRQYARDIHQAPVANLAVGSSQVGAIFSHWVADPPQPLEVFSVAGMKTLDYVLYQEQIAARNPERVILYVSAFDLTAGPELFSWPLAPAHPRSIWSTLQQVRALGVPPELVSGPSHQYIVSQLLPEYRASYIFRGFLKQWTSHSPVRVASDLLMPPLLAAVPAASVVQAPAADPARVREFTSYYLPEWLDYNYFFLRSFVAFCARRGIDVVIVEGQVSPLVASPKLDALAATVRSRFAELASLYPNVRIVTARDSYQFAAGDYQDFTHVHPEAARLFTRQLSGRIGGVAPPPPGACDLVFVSGWHGQEGTADDWLRWSSGSGRLRVRAREPGVFTLEGEVLSLARPNVVDLVVDGEAGAGWTIADPAWAFHPFAPLRLSVGADSDVTIELISRAAPAKQATDPRALTIAVKNLRLTRADGLSCAVTP